MYLKHEKAKLLYGIATIATMIGIGLIAWYWIVRGIIQFILFMMGLA